jgi:hypothetical protein
MYVRAVAFLVPGFVGACELANSPFREKAPLLVCRGRESSGILREFVRTTEGSRHSLNGPAQFAANHS